MFKVPSNKEEEVKNLPPKNRKLVKGTSVDKIDRKMNMITRNRHNLIRI